MLNKTILLLALAFLTTTLSQTATRYNWPGDGDSCRKHGFVSWSVNYDGGFCGAISEGLFSDIGVSGSCGSSTCSPNWSGCNDCCDESKISPPNCPYRNLCTPESGQSARYICVKCNEPSVCKHSDWVRIGISEACPSSHPCNSCKGYNNPCANGKKTVDLCETSFWNLFSNQVGDNVNGGGNKILINTNWRSNCPNPGRNSGGSSGGSSGGNTGSTGSCTDNPPDSRYTCAQQAEWGKCRESFMANFCHKSCGRCTSSCTDNPPNSQYTCAQQAEWKKCGESFMANFCHRSCGRCRNSISDDENSEFGDMTSSESSTSSTVSALEIALIVIGSVAILLVIVVIVMAARADKPERI